MNELIEIEVDYSRIGKAEHFVAPLFLYEVEELSEGGYAVIKGDSVPSRVARVLRLDSSACTGEFEFTNGGVQPSRKAEKLRRAVSLP